MINSIPDYKQGLISVTGPSRGGKSKFAENLLKDKSPVIYIATSSKNGSLEWEKRIINHKIRRPKQWQVIEDPQDLPDLIATFNYPNCILIDSIGGFVAKYIEEEDHKWTNIENRFINVIEHSSALIIIVIEETGWGIVPHTKIGNLFRDRLGSFSQLIQQISMDSWLVIQGRAVNLLNISIPIN